MRLPCVVRGIYYRSEILTNHIFNGGIVCAAVRNKETAEEVDHDDAPVGGLKRKKAYVDKKQLSNEILSWFV